MAWYDGAFAAWSPYGAADATAAREDLIGSNDLAGGSPTWTASSGFTTAVEFGSLTLLPEGGAPFTAIWVGIVNKSTIAPNMFFRAGGWAEALTIHAWTDGIYAGAVDSQAQRLGPIFGPNYNSGHLLGIGFRENADGTSKVFLRNHSVSRFATPVSGSSGIAGNLDVQVATCNGGSFRAAGIWHSALSDSDINRILLTAGVPVMGVPLINGFGQSGRLMR